MMLLPSVFFSADVEGYDRAACSPRYHPERQKFKLDLTGTSMMSRLT